MASINLDVLKKTHPQATADDPRLRVSSPDKYTYKDIKLDIVFGSILGNFPTNKPSNNSDIADLRDVEDIKQSIFNIFNTIPGQKLLNPNFGLNLTKYAFDPITEQTADHIARTILIILPAQEPRISIGKLNIIGNIEQSTYTVNMIVNLHASGIENVYVTGSIQQTGFRLK